MRHVIKVTAAVLLLASVVQPARAQTPTLPTVVSEGLDLLVADKRSEAVAAWGRVWTGADTVQAATLRASLEEIGGLMGRARGYDLVRAFEIGENVRHLYVIIRYDKQPLYAFFLVYRPAREWQVNAVRWNTDAAAVFPTSLISPP